MSLDTAVTVRAVRILIERDPGPGDRLDAFLLLAGKSPSGSRRLPRLAVQPRWPGPRFRHGLASGYQPVDLPGAAVRNGPEGASSFASPCRASRDRARPRERRRPRR